MAVINQPERKLAKRTSVQSSKANNKLTAYCPNIYCDLFALGCVADISDLDMFDVFNNLTLTMWNISAMFFQLDITVCSDQFKNNTKTRPKTPTILKKVNSIHPNSRLYVKLRPSLFCLKKFEFLRQFSKALRKIDHVLL